MDRIYLPAQLVALRSQKLIGNSAEIFTLTADFMRSMKTTFKLLLAVALLAIGAASHGQDNMYRIPFKKPEWYKDTEPFRIAGNLYYVGTYDLGSYLITTPQGHILINTGMFETVPQLKKHVEDLGFKFTDVKVLLTNHVHYDHVAGMAEVRRTTGAKLMVNERDAQVMTDGGNSDYLMGGKGPSFEPAKPDRLLHDSDIIQLGDMKIIAIRHPGHTKGATSYVFDVKDEERSYRVLIANMPSVIVDTPFEHVHAYPDIAKDYAYTFKELRKQRFDIWLAAHASQFDMHKKRPQGAPYNPKVFFDRKGFDEAISSNEKDYFEKLKKK